MIDIMIPFKPFYSGFDRQENNKYVCHFLFFFRIFLFCFSFFFLLLFSGAQNRIFPPLAKVLSPELSRTVLYVRDLTKSQHSRVEPVRKLDHSGGGTGFSFPSFFKEKKNSSAEGPYNPAIFHFTAVVCM